MAEPALIDRIEAGSRRPPPPAELSAVEVMPTQPLPAGVLPTSSAGERPPAPDALGAGRAAAARTSVAMQARFGNARAARLMSDSPVTAGRPGAGAEALAGATGTPGGAAPAGPAAAAPAPAEAGAEPAEPAEPAGAAPEVAPAAPSLAAPPAAAALGIEPPPSASATPPPAAPPPTEGAPAEGAAPAPPPALDTSSTEGMIASIASFPPSALGSAVSQASAALPGLQEQEKRQLAQSLPEIDRPTGLPPRPAPPEGEATELTVPAPVEGETPEARQGEPPPLGGEVATGPLPGAEVSTSAPEPPVQEEDDGDSWWSSIWGRIKSFLRSLPTTDSGVATSAGPRPNVDMSGDADPSLNRRQQGDSDVQVQAARARADAATHADFGENDIAPVVPAGERLRPAYQPGAPPGAMPRGKEAPPVDPEVQAAFDRQASPKLAETVAEQRSQEAVDREAYCEKSAEVRAEGKRQIEAETESSRTEQQGLRDAARADVQAERDRWREADARAGKEYSEQSEAKRRETDEQVEKKAETAEKQADEKLGEAERQAEAKKRETEAQAAAKKREAESRPRSWWDRAKGAISSAFSALKRAVTGLFNVLRAAVKKLINAAKAIVRGLIEAARMAIVGLIKGFALALKGLVSIALFAFPKTAAKARAFIDDRVDETVSAVNRAADALKSACDRILDWVAEGLDFALGLLQKAVLFYIELYEKLVMLLLDVLERIGNLVSAGKQMPDHFFGQMTEEVLGMDLTQPLPMERTAPPSPASAAQAALDAGAVDTSDARVLQQGGIDEEQLKVQQLALGEELDRELIEELAPVDGKEIEFGERSGPEFTLPGLQAAAAGLQPSGSQARASNDGDGAGAEITDDQRLAEMAKQTEDPCAKPAEGPAGPSQVPEHLKIGPLTPGQRAGHLVDQMKKGIKQWFACNWGKLLAGAVAVLLGVVLLNMLTGGAIMAALPLLMKVVAAVMLGAAVVRVTSYMGDYLSQGWDGQIGSAAKALARALAIAAIEVVFAVLFNVRAVLKALKGGLKSAVKGAAGAAKATMVGGVKATRDLGRVGVQGAKAVVRNGKLLLSGVSRGFAKGAKSVKDLAARLWKRLPFRKFKIAFARGRFKLFGWVNPWVLLSDGRVEFVSVEGRGEIGDIVTVAGQKRAGVVIGIVGQKADEATAIVQKIKGMSPAKRQTYYRRLRAEGSKDAMRAVLLEAAATGANAKQLRKAMTGARKVLAAGDDAHHIVPSTHRNARQARAVLGRWGININDAVNGVALKKALHGGMHSNDYMTKVTALLTATKSKAEALIVLKKIEKAAKSGGLKAVLQL